MGRASVSKDKEIEITALLKDGQSKRTAAKILVRRETTGLHSLTQFIGKTDSMRRRVSQEIQLNIDGVGIGDIEIKEI